MGACSPVATTFILHVLIIKTLPALLSNLTRQTISADVILIGLLAIDLLTVICLVAVNVPLVRAVAPEAI